MVWFVAISLNVTVLLLFVYIAVQSVVQSTSSLPIFSTPASSRSSTGEVKEVYAGPPEAISEWSGPA